MISEQLRKKLSALLSMTKENGASEAEASQAMKVAARLLAEHNLSPEDVYKENLSVTLTLNPSYGNTIWQKVLWNTLASNNGVLALLIKGDNVNITLFGPQYKIGLVKELYEYAFSTCISFGKVKAKKATSTRYKFWTSYGYGFAKGVAELYTDLVTEMNSTAIVLDTQEKLKEAYGGVLKTKAKKINVTSAYDEGKKDGRNLRKGITAANSFKQLKG